MKFLLAWELGGGLGYSAPLAQIARPLLAVGFAQWEAPDPQRLIADERIALATCNAVLVALHEPALAAAQALARRYWPGGEVDFGDVAGRVAQRCEALARC